MEEENLYFQSWKMGLRCWAIGEDGEKIDRIPRYPLLLPSGEPLIIPKYKGKVTAKFEFIATLKDKEHYKLPKFLMEIPLEIRKTAAVFIRFQWLILEAICHVDGFKDFIETEINQGSPHFVDTCLLFSKAKSMSFDERLILYGKIQQTKREVLLGQFMDLPCSKLFIKSLRKLDKVAPKKDVLLILRHLTCSAAKSRVISQIKGSLTHKLLHALAQMPDWLSLPGVVNILDNSQEQWNRLDSIFPPAILEAELRWQEKLSNSFSSCKSLTELEQKICQWTNELFEDQPFPAPPIPGNQLLVPIQSSKNLREEGREMHHCVAGYVSDVARGDSYFYRWLGSERATVQLAKFANHWQVYEQLGFKNKALSNQTVFEINRCCADQMIDHGLLRSKIRIAGIPYYQAHDFEKEWATSRPQNVILKAEHDNEHDPCAVAVFSERGLKLGYVPKAENGMIFNLLNANIALGAEVTTCKNVGNHLKIIIQIRLESENRS